LDPETSRALHRGRIVYQQHCAKCHDSDGGGRPFMKGSNLRRVAGKLSAESIRQALERGRGEMPSFAGVLNDQQVGGVVQYLLLDLLEEER
jgi:cytochrome c6